MKKKSVFTKKEKMVCYFAIKADLKRIAKTKAAYKKISADTRIPLQFRTDLYYVGWTEDDVKYLKSAMKKIAKL